MTAFAFGENWLRFLETINESSVEASKNDLAAMLGDISDKTFVDVGCGSGLSSLAAHRWAQRCGPSTTTSNAWSVRRSCNDGFVRIGLWNADQLSTVTTSPASVSSILCILGRPASHRRYVDRY